MTLIQLCTKPSARAHLLKYKYVNARHQAPNTHSKNLVNRVNSKIEAIVTKYRHVFAMLQALDKCEEAEWHSEFLVLRNQDVHGLSEMELPNIPSLEHVEELQARSLLSGNIIPEGNRTVSWIWRGSLQGSFRDQSGEDEYGKG